MKKRYFFACSLIIFLFCLNNAESVGSDSKEEIGRLRDKFADITMGTELESEYLCFLRRKAIEIFFKLKEKNGGEASQFFLLVDRQPQKQIIFIGYYNSPEAEIYDIAHDRVSTGDPNRSGYFLTPTGVFTNSGSIIGYRALGTKNDRGWMGLGVKGSRVWDFGWQETEDYRWKWEGKRAIRLLLHATDPVQGEERLGKPGSKGCIRISNRLNHFLDYYGLIDKEYEEKRDSAAIAFLLGKNREPVDAAGRYLMVIDSGESN